jgi:hypothetical protein
MLILEQKLSPEQVEELHDDIERYLSLERDEINIDFWTVSIPPCIALLPPLLMRFLRT